jgi:hypothetical protein
MEFQDKINTVLIIMTHYFAAFRMPELAIINVLALVTMNFQNHREKYHLLMNGIFTYLMGYTYFLEQTPSSGVYMFLLGILCMGTSIRAHLQTIAEDWNSRFCIQKEEAPILEQEEQEEEEEQEEQEEEQEEPPTLEQEELSNSESQEDHTKTE